MIPGEENGSPRALALHRARALRPLLDLERQGEPIARAMAEVADNLGIDRSHAWRLFHRLKANEGRASALLPRRPGQKPGSRRLLSAVEALIDDTLRQRFLVPERPSLLRIVTEIRAECRARGYRAPARQTVKARLDAMDQRDVLRRREGAKVARDALAPRSGSLAVTHPLEVVQIDHTLADVVLVDQVEREALQRPWLSLAVDVTTRMVLGVHVSFDRPSVLSVALCLEHAMRDKSVTLDGEGEHLRWPAAGVPRAIHVDNAKEFRSLAFREACDEWGIELRYRPRGRPHYGGHVERLIGTCMGTVHVLPGSTAASPKAKGDYDSVAAASMTLSEFEDWLALELWRYHNSRHAGLGRTPLAAWAAQGGDEAGRRIVDHDAFRISFLPSVRRRLGRTGIKLFSIGYWSDAFGALLGRLSDPVVVKYDPRDLSAIWVVTKDDRVIVARYRDLSRPSISLWEQRHAAALFQERHGGEMPEHALFAIIAEQRRLAEAARQRTKVARLERERQARLPRKASRKRAGEAMFAVDTANPDLPTYAIDDADEG